WRDGATRRGIPCKAALALIGEPDAVDSRCCAQAGKKVGDQFFGIMLDMVRGRVDLPVLDGMNEADAGLVQQQRAGRGRALIDCKNSHCSSSMISTGAPRGGSGKVMRRSGRLSIFCDAYSAPPARATMRPLTGRLTRNCRHVWARSSASATRCGITQASASPVSVT